MVNVAPAEPESTFCPAPASRVDFENSTFAEPSAFALKVIVATAFDPEIAAVPPPEKVIVPPLIFGSTTQRLKGEPSFDTDTAVSLLVSYVMVASPVLTASVPALTIIRTANVLPTSKLPSAGESR